MTFGIETKVVWVVQRKGADGKWEDYYAEDQTWEKHRTMFADAMEWGMQWGKYEFRSVKRTVTEEVCVDP